jgi:hypothetical protein
VTTRSARNADRVQYLADRLNAGSLGVVLVAALVIAMTGAAAAQFGGGFGPRFVAAKFPNADTFGHGFVFCRGIFRSDRREAGGTGWSTDYPDAELNFSIRLSELTKTRVNRGADGTPVHVTVRLTDDALFKCPYLHMEDVGTMALSDEEVLKLREYLLKGGFLWVDDYWGDYAWDQWVEQIARVLPPSEFPIADLPLEHPIWQSQFQLKELPQIPAIQSWRRISYDTSERGEPHAELPRHRRHAWPRLRADDAQHRHFRRLGARRRGPALLLPVLAQGLRRRHRRDALCDDALGGG